MSEQPPHWSQVQETGTVLGIRIMLLIYRLFGRVAFSVMLTPVMIYYYLTHSVAREASKQYQQLLTPLLSQKQQTNLGSIKHFMHFADMILDKLLVWMGKFGTDNIVFETPTVVDGIKSSGKGAIIIVSHLGNIEVCNALRQKMAQVRLTILVNTHNAEKFNSLMKRLGSDNQAELMQVNDFSPATAMLLSERINAGDLIVIAGDRTPNQPGRISEVEFLGKTASLPQGAFILASLLQCPVYLIFCLKQKQKYHVYVELFSEKLVFVRKLRAQQLDAVVQKYANRLEYYCIKAPLQWFNFFPFWQKVNTTNQADKSQH